MKICNRLVESSPTVELVVTVKGKCVAELHQYWTQNGGIYGYQIVSRRGFNNEYSERVTGGWGYDKEADDFGAFLTTLLGHHVPHSCSVPYLLSGTKYHKGGNYCEIPLQTLKRLVKIKM